MARTRKRSSTRRTGRKKGTPPTTRKRTAEAAPVGPATRCEVPRVRGTGPVPLPERAGLRSAAPRAQGGARIVSVAAPATTRMIILPRRGLRAEGTGLEAHTVNALTALGDVVGRGSVTLASVVNNVGLAASPALAGSATLKVVDSIAENGAKLVEMNPGDEAAVRAALPGLRLVPEVFYQPMSLRLSLESDLQPTGAASTVKIRVKSSKDGAPVRDVRVIGFTNFALRLGADGRADANGVASLRFGSKPATLERLYAFAERGFWSQLRRNVSTTGQITVSLDPIDLSVKDVLRTIYGETPLTMGSGVKVGVIDTGSGPHPQLVIAGGFNAVTGENPNDFGDNGDLHGTHVAGIIAARGGSPTGVRGLAPGVSLFSYRVFPQGQNASNFDIAKAIDRARTDGCDVINLSLGRPADAGEGPDEPLVRFALEDARAAGMLPIAAAGNDGRAPVAFPGADDLCLAISAMGNRKTQPASSVSSAAFAPPTGTDPNEFIADFSNIGPEIDLLGPGVGIISPVIPADFAVMDGTSMACPAVTGIVARLLAAQSTILTMARNAARSAAIAQMAIQAARTRGFAAQFEGHGLPI